MKEWLRWDAMELGQMLQLFLGVWNFQVFSVDGNGVSLGKLILGLVLFLFGVSLSRRAANHIERRFLSRLDVQPSVRYNLRSLILYVLVIFVALFVLRLLNIPLTVFAVVGGALAIGLGFGSQNIVNNFISGLILMVEQPVRVGDYIEADTFLGTIEMIGARSTRVRSAGNTQVIVPNSFFLEKIINNWTLKDRVIRYKVTFSAVYGSPTREIEKLVQGLINDCRDIVRTPAPEVTVTELGPYGVGFEVSYCALMDSIKAPSQISTELRHQIHELFLERGYRFAVAPVVVTPGKKT